MILNRLAVLVLREREALQLLEILNEAVYDQHSRASHSPLCAAVMYASNIKICST